MLLVVGVLVIALVYSQSQWTIYGAYPLLLLVGLILCGVGLAAASYAVGFAKAEREYTSRLSSLGADVKRKRRELRNLSGVLERKRKRLVAARREVAAARRELAAKRRRLAAVSGKLGEKEKRLKKIRKIVGAS